MSDWLLAVIILSLVVVAALGTCHEQNIHQAKWNKCIDTVRDFRKCEELR